MDKLYEKLTKELQELTYQIVDLNEKKFRYARDNGIEIYKTPVELEELDIQIQSSSNYYHILQGFAAGVKYATLRKSKQNNWIVPERYSDTLEKVLGLEQTERLTSKN